MWRKTGRLHHGWYLLFLLTLSLLVGCGPESEVDRLIQDLNSRSAARKIRAVQTLGLIKTPAAIEPVAAMLHDDDAAVRRCATWVLGQIDDPRSVQVLLNALRHDDSNVVKEALSGLAKNNSPAVLSALTDTLQHKDPKVRRKAASELGTMGDRRAIGPLKRSLTDRQCGRQAAQALRRLGWTPQTQEDKIHSLVAEESWTRLKEDWPSARDVLLKEVDSSDYQVIENALCALMNIAPEEATLALIDKLNRSDRKALAEVYLNSPYEKLRQAAEKWARDRGCPIATSGPGGSRPRSLQAK
ncbi:MAG: HEAT repeat domain-containing protein [Thermodesulfobacteriota bacterium]